MARGTITPYIYNHITGLDLSTATATTGVPADGHKVANRPGMFVDVKNTNGASTARVVTFVIPGGRDGQAIVPRTKSIAAGKTFRLGPWPSADYGSQLLIDVDHAELTIVAFAPDSLT